MLYCINVCFTRSVKLFGEFMRPTFSSTDISRMQFISFANCIVLMLPSNGSLKRMYTCSGFSTFGGQFLKVFLMLLKSEVKSRYCAGMFNKGWVCYIVLRSNFVAFQNSEK